MRVPWSWPSDEGAAHRSGTRDLQGQARRRLTAGLYLCWAPRRLPHPASRHSQDTPPGRHQRSCNCLQVTPPSCQTHLRKGQSVVPCFSPFSFLNVCLFNFFKTGGPQDLLRRACAPWSAHDWRSLHPRPRQGRVLRRHCQALKRKKKEREKKTSFCFFIFVSV